MDVSVVIPTRDRPESLNRCLLSLAAQRHPLKEIIIVDASEQPLDQKQLADRHATLNLIVMRSKPSVCLQRNVGIRTATASHILLSDDDIEFPVNYVSELAAFQQDHAECGAVSGVLLESLKGELQETTAQRTTFSELSWRFLFQLTVWSDLESLRATGIAQVILQGLQKYYRNRSNSFTLAGWPLVTQASGDRFRTAIFGLGAALVTREWLLASPYDEILDPHGIGDNYGVAVHFPGHFPITVLRSVKATHHRSRGNRLSATEAYYRRILALDYFMTGSPKFTWINRIFLLWSLGGNLFSQVVHFNFYRACATCKAGLLICIRRNPYSVAAESGLAGPTIPNL